MSAEADEPRASEERPVESILPADLSEGFSTKFQQGNQLWKVALRNRNRMGRFPTAETVLEMFCEYMAWCEDNALQEARLVTYEGESSLEEVPKKRAMTLAGLCAFMGIHRDTWGAWRRGDQRPGFKVVVEWCEQMMWDDKFVAAGAGLLNTNLIARELGLVDRQQVDNKTTVVIEGDEAGL